MIPGCFRLDDHEAHARWRDARLARAPAAPADLVVEVGDIAALSAAEKGALRQRLERANMAVYAEGPKPGRDHKAALKALAAQLGLATPDANALADDDGVTPLSVHREGIRARYIPYTERPIAWHTDGYYNPPGRTVRALLLHCVRRAAEGGANRLMDHEMLYILLRDQDPELIRALTRPDAMTIPGNDEEGLARPATAGPVFSLNPDGSLHMRYTARARNVIWSAEAAPAAAAIRRLLDGPSPHVFEHALEPGQGLVSNNPLHTREPFGDDPASPRLLYRARYPREDFMTTDDPQFAREEVTPIATLDAPWSREIGFSAVDHESGLRILRMRIREGRARFTIVDLDEKTVADMMRVMGEWAKA